MFYYLFVFLLFCMSYYTLPHLYHLHVQVHFFHLAAINFVLCSIAMFAFSLSSSRAPKTSSTNASLPLLQSKSDLKPLLFHRRTYTQLIMRTRQKIIRCEHSDSTHTKRDESLAEMDTDSTSHVQERLQSTSYVHNTLVLVIRRAMWYLRCLWCSSRTHKKCSTQCDRDQRRLLWHLKHKWVVDLYAVGVFAVVVGLVAVFR